MLDPVILAGMIFSLIVLAMVGGFILLLPLSRRLVDVLERVYLSDESEGRAGGDVDGLRRELARLQREVARLSERQEFTERLLADPEGRGGKGGS